MNRAGSGDLGKMRYSELAEIRVLYLRVAGDLAYSRSHRVDEGVEDYLNDLVARGHGLLYAAPNRSFQEGLVELFYTGPEVLRRRMPYVLFAIGIFLIGALCGAALVAMDRSWVATLTPPGFEGALEHWKTGRFETPGGIESFAFGAFLNINNTKVCIILFTSGITWGLLPAYLLFNNGLMLGVFGVELASVGQGMHFFAGIAGHGVPELSAIFFSGGGAFMLAHALIAPGELSRIDALRENGKEGFWLLAVAMVLLIQAAVVEAFFSHSQLPNSVKIGFAALSMAVLLGFIYGIRRPTAEAPTAQTKS